MSDTHADRERQRRIARRPPAVRQAVPSERIGGSRAFTWCIVRARNTDDNRLTLQAIVVPDPTQPLVYTATGPELTGYCMPTFTISMYNIPGLVKPIPADPAAEELGVEALPVKLHADGTVELVFKPIPNMTATDRRQEAT